MFGDEDRLSTATILDRLFAIEEAPWSDWYGKPLTPRRLANLLKPYGVRSRNIKQTDGTVAKGYHRDDLEDAWTRYLARSMDIAATSVTQLPTGENPEPAPSAGKGN